MNWIEPTLVVAAVAAALNAGAFFAFSNFVMPALADLPSPEGAAAMQAINRFAPNPLFVATIFGAGMLGIPALLAEWGRWADGSFRWLVAGVAMSVTSLLITIVCNVPRNDRLAAVDAAAPSSRPVWTDYVAGWTVWNTTRTLASTASVVAYVLAAASR